MVGQQAAVVQAEDTGQIAAMVATPTKTRKLEKPTKTPLGVIKFSTPETSRLCGELVYLTNYKDPTKQTIGLRPCGGSVVYIFGTHPRDLIQYYQFRDPKIGTGKKICTVECGCIDEYLNSFKNYIGIKNCSQCGVAQLPPTWTEIPLTPYTPTPRPPTSTPNVPSPTSTETPTFSPAQVTQTPGLFELLFGTLTSTASPTAAQPPPPAATQPQPPPTAQATTPTRTNP